MDVKNIKKLLGSSLKEIRVAKGLTQEQLAERIGRESGTIYRIEAGKTFANARTFAKLTEVLDIPPSVLLTSRPDMVLKNHAETMKAITQLLQSFPQDKLVEIYNILNAMHR